MSEAKVQLFDPYLDGPNKPLAGEKGGPATVRRAVIRRRSARNCTPCSASRSRCGVRMIGSPAQPSTRGLWLIGHHDDEVGTRLLRHGPVCSLAISYQRSAFSRQLSPPSQRGDHRLTGVGIYMDGQDRQDGGGEGLDCGFPPQ